jgi:hypothetical protein
VKSCWNRRGTFVGCVLNFPPTQIRKILFNWFGNSYITLWTTVDFLLCRYWHPPCSSCSSSSTKLTHQDTKWINRQPKWLKISILDCVSYSPIFTFERVCAGEILMGDCFSILLGGIIRNSTNMTIIIKFIWFFFFFRQDIPSAPPFLFFYLLLLLSWAIINSVVSRGWRNAPVWEW